MIDKEKILSDLGDCLAYYESGEPEDNEENLNREIKRYIININNGHFDIKPVTCKWILIGKPTKEFYIIDRIYKASCHPDSLIGLLKNPSLLGYNYCHFCGKSIEEAKNE